MPASKRSKPKGNSYDLQMGKLIGFTKAFEDGAAAVATHGRSIYSHNVNYNLVSGWMVNTFQPHTNTWAFQFGSYYGQVVAAAVPFGGVGAASSAGRGARQITQLVRSVADDAANHADDLPQGTGVIGKVKDLEKVGDNEFTLLSRLPDQGSPRLNWKQSSGVLRQLMGRGQPIRDASVGPSGLIQYPGSFLNAERYLLQSRGWTFDPKATMWMPPG